LREVILSPGKHLRQDGKRESERWNGGGYDKTPIDCG